MISKALLRVCIKVRWLISFAEKVNIASKHQAGEYILIQAISQPPRVKTFRNHWRDSKVTHHSEHGMDNVISKRCAYFSSILINIYVTGVLQTSKEERGKM